MLKQRKRIVFLLAAMLLVSGCGKKQEAKTEGETKETMGTVETVKTDSFSMKYLKFGNGDRPLVILPGLSVQSVMGSAEAIETAYAKMTDEFTIYLFDRREELPETYSIKEMAKDTIVAIHALGLSDICLYGTSQGGMISMEIAGLEPELVQKLILASTSCNIRAEQNAGIQNWIQLAEDKNAEGLYLSFGELVYPKEVFDSNRETFINMAKSVTEEELERFTVLAGTIIDFNCVDDLKQVKCPVLVLGSNDDQVLGKDACPEIAEVLQGSTDCELYMYDGYGHAVYDLAPDFLDRIKTFCLN
ncbi:MAG: alpha/beta hydrolase [Solobacterium sp.]|nr:alpha/beta hydrolase [Solobacterium sp.]